MNAETERHMQPPMNALLQPLGPCMTSPRKRRPGARGRRAAMMGGLGGATRRAVSESGPRQPRPGSVLAGLAGRGRRPRTVSDIDRAAPSVTTVRRSQRLPARLGHDRSRPSAAPTPPRHAGCREWLAGRACGRGFWRREAGEPSIMTVRLLRSLPTNPASELAGWLAGAVGPGRFLTWGEWL